MVKRSHDQLKVDEVLMRFIIASEQAEWLLSKKQQSRRELQTSFRVRVNISPFVATHTDRVMSITGTPENIASTIGSLTKTWAGKKHDQELTLRMITPGPLIVKLVGRKGTTLRRLHRKSGAKLEVAKEALSDSTDRLFTAAGVPDAIHRLVYYTCLIFHEYANLLKNSEKGSRPYQPHNTTNPLRRRITSGTYTPPESPTEFVSRKKKTSNNQHATVEKKPTTNPSHNHPIDLSQTLETKLSACVEDEEDLFQQLNEIMPCSPPPETEYKLASKRYESSPPSPLLLDTPTALHKEEEIITCPPSPPLSVDDETVTKRLMVTCPMVGTVLSLSEELLNLMRQNSGAAIRVKEIVSHEQVQLLITGTKAQVSRVIDDLTLTTRNSYLFTKAIEQSEEYVEEETEA